MRIVIVTGQSQRHKHLCVALASKHDVVGIIHPRIAKQSGSKRVVRLLQIHRTHGWMQTFLHLLARAPSGLSGWNPDAEDRKAESRLFPAMLQDAEALKKSEVHRDVAVNSNEGVELV